MNANAGTAEGLRRYSAAEHHVAVEIAKHAASPLSAAMLIFGVHKTWQAPMARAWFAGLVRRGQGWMAGVKPQESGVHAAKARSSVILRRSRSASTIGLSAPSKEQDEAKRNLSTWSRAGAAPLAPWDQTRNHLYKCSAPTFSTKTNMLNAARPGISRATRNTQVRSMHSLVEWTAQNPRIVENLNNLHKLYDPADVERVAHHVIDLPSVHVVENFLYYVHGTQGLPWCASILAATVVLRLILVPVNVSLLMNATRMKVAMPDMIKARDQIDAAEGLPLKLEADEKLRQVFIKHKCHPTRNWFFPFVLPPMILSVFCAVHNILLIEPEASSQGMLWFTDLSAPDTSGLLALMSNASWLVMLELSAGIYYHWWRGFKDVARFTSVATIPLAAGLPSGVLLFWTTSNLWAICRIMILRRDSVRDALSIPRISVINSLDWLPKPDRHVAEYDTVFYSKWVKKRK